MTFGFSLQVMLPSVYFHFKQSRPRSRETETLKALMLFLCQSLCAAVSLLCMKLSCTHNFFAEPMKKQQNKHSGTGYRTTFNGNTLQKLSSLQTRHSVLQSVCEVVGVVLQNFVLCNNNNVGLLERTNRKTYQMKCAIERNKYVTLDSFPLSSLKQHFKLTIGRFLGIKAKILHITTFHFCIL